MSTPATPTPTPFVPPAGTPALIDAQLAEALLILRDLRIIVHDPKTDSAQCCHVAHTAGSLMNCCATLAKVARDFQLGQPEETRYRMIVERREEGGRPNVENE